MVISEEEQQERASFDIEQIGGYLNPLESFSLQIDNPNNIPDLIPIKINRNDGSSATRFFLSRNKLEGLDTDYKKWKEQNE